MAAWVRGCKFQTAANMVRSLSLALLLFGAAYSLPAHGDVHEQIVALDVAIDADPENADLYRKRADLHRRHGDFEQALADLERAQQLSPAPLIDHLLMARVHHENDASDQALRHLDTVLELSPDHRQGLLLRAATYCALDEWEAAAGDYDRVWPMLEQTRPEHVLDRAGAHFMAGQGYAAAMAAIDEGQQRLGHLVVLEQAAIAYAVGAHDHDEALRRIDARLGYDGRTAWWLHQRAEVLLAADRKKEALADCERAQDAIAAMPSAVQNRPATKRLTEALWILHDCLNADRANAE